MSITLFPYVARNVGYSSFKYLIYTPPNVCCRNYPLHWLHVRVRYRRLVFPLKIISVAIALQVPANFTIVQGCVKLARLLTPVPKNIAGKLQIYTWAYIYNLQPIVSNTYKTRRKALQSTLKLDL